MKSNRSTLKRVSAAAGMTLLGGILGAVLTFYTLLDMNPPQLTTAPGNVAPGARHQPVALSSVPQDLIHATLAAEDNRFYQHSGVDVPAIFRSVKNNATGRSLQGAGTITMQLARNVVLNDHSRSMRRKLREAFVALQLEREYTKDQILESYLNNIFFGARSYGVQAASRAYFGKDVEKLTVSEAALLAGLPKAPGVYSPFKDLEKAKARRDAVLRSMRKQNYIDSDFTLQQLIDEPIKLRPKLPGTLTDADRNLAT